MCWSDFCHLALPVQCSGANRKLPLPCRDSRVPVSDRAFFLSLVAQCGQVQDRAKTGPSVRQFEETAMTTHHDIDERQAQSKTRPSARRIEADKALECALAVIVSDTGACVANGKADILCASRQMNGHCGSDWRVTQGILH